MAKITIVMTFHDDTSTRCTGDVFNAATNQRVVSGIVVTPGQDAELDNLANGSYFYAFTTTFNGSPSKFQLTADDVNGSLRGQTTVLNDGNQHNLQFFVK
jgi:hypothetical protein